MALIKFCFPLYIFLTITCGGPTSLNFSTSSLGLFGFLVVLHKFGVVLANKCSISKDESKSCFEYIFGASITSL